MTFVETSDAHSHELSWFNVSSMGWDGFGVNGSISLRALLLGLLIDVNFVGAS